MPILSFADTPPSRYPDTPIVESRETWWIAKVKPRREKALARELVSCQVEYYLPYYKKKASRSDCSSFRMSLLPLFPSYVPFACKDEPWPLLKIDSISTILPVKAQQRFKRELNTIYLAYEQHISVLPVLKHKPAIGETVRVIAGPLQGITGKITRLKGISYFYLLVEGLGGACIEVDGRLTELYDAFEENSRE
jgi:hypothetical protein